MNFFAGPKVVSQTIDIESIDELTSVLKRKPVIWDNIHANDYDQRRLFLGPHKGLSLQLYSHTAGFLKNPNCEFESNFVAFHTTATWLRIARTLCVNGTDGNSDGESLEEDSLYDWKLALSEAVDCWMEVFRMSRDAVQFSKFHSSKVVTGVGLGEEAGEKCAKETVNGTEPEGKTEEDSTKETKPNGKSKVLYLGCQAM